METKITRRVREWIAKEQLLAQGMNVIVGYSGGSDSLCLLLLLRDIAADLSLNLTAVHVNHGIRGAEADRDEAFCRETAERLGVAFRAVSVDIPALAKERGKGIEETGRTERYRIFSEIAAEVSAASGNATRVAVAHHADDNAETILMHLVRGSGLRGLTGIPADSTPFADKTVHLIRPLLPLTKKDILAELSARGETYCEDATNYEADGDRNILRNRIMPLLAELNPRAGAHIASAGTHLSAAWRFMDEQAKEAFRRVCRDGNPSANSPAPQGSSRDLRNLELDVEALLALPAALQSEVAMHYLAAVCGHRKDLTDAHAAMVQKLAKSTVSAEATFPYGVTLVRGYRHVYPKREKEEFAGRHEVGRRELERGVKLTFFGGRPRVLTFAVYERAAEDCGETGAGATCGETGAAARDSEQSVNFTENQYTKRFDYDTIGKACVVRTRRPGDRITITADGHTKTVQDVFVNAKFPRTERDNLPLVLTADEAAVIWIPGVRGSEAYRVTDATKRVLEIRMDEL